MISTNKYYNVKFRIEGNSVVKMPTKFVNGNFLRCQIRVGKYDIYCDLVFLGDDYIMKKGKWYNGTIRLACGDGVATPYDSELKELLTYNVTFNLINSGKIGECIFINAITE